MSSWAGGLKGWLDIFLESACPLCDRSTPQILCPSCQHQLQQCHAPEVRPLPEALTAVAWGEYGGALKRAIATLKYENHPELARPLGEGLAQAWLSSAKPAKSFTVIPIPMHSKKVAQRGFNQAELIAQVFCEHTGLPLKRQGLCRIQETEAQFKLSASAREQNLAGVFALGKDFQRQRPVGPVLLVDDIYTTGATVRSAVRVLRRQQISVCGVAVVAIGRSRV